MSDLVKPSDSEQEYFKQKDLELLAELREKNARAREAAAQVRRSPVTGEPLVQKTFHGVTIDVCPTSGGVWLDAGELDVLMKVNQSAVGGFLKNLLGR
ncbi:MAG: zf-TFIIB domain-containing protein [Gemmatimonadota bacterium]|jgi:hypothetical protein|nr:zf-TFIIB domain-containing protein [Gemmatimonadota bacterium]